jgi:tRNA (Thr-GGU) A37 N-methylase
VLWVKGLDAFNGSPVLDVKPYTKKPLSKVRTPD